VNIVWWLLVGLIAGFLARAIVPGRDPMGWVPTLLLGLIGSLIGGFLGDLFTESDAFSPAGLVGSIIGAIVALLIYRGTMPNRNAHT
jgi:uncharacterized membrane protein YeaQ/YmgE (transglycosylase-associated protein family)